MKVAKKNQQVDECQEMASQDIKWLANCLSQVCPNCQGRGVVYSQQWAKWWSIHDKDWKDALNGTDMPQEPEELICNICKGHKRFLTEAGKEFVSVLRLAMKLEQSES